MFILLLSNTVNAEDSSCSRPVKIQMVQIQDGSNSFENDVGYMKKFMGNITEQLAETYGSIEYGMAAFTDKPQVITGSGRNEAVWKDFDTSGYQSDYCYHMVQPLSEGAIDIESLNMGGGKDPDENMMDALVYGAIDPHMNWREGEIADDGSVLVKLAVLVTDAASHRNSDYDKMAERRNWYHEELMNGPCYYGDTSCEAWHGNNTSKSGVTLNLEGVLSHYRHFNVKSDSEMLTAREYWGWGPYDQLAEYRYCCTDAYNSFPYVYYNSCDNFDSYEKCADVSCKHCKKGMCDEYCEDKDYVVNWMKEIELPELDIKEYVYGDARLNVDDTECATMEYPDPFSKEYADMFKKYDVTPLLFLRLPAEVPILGDYHWPFQIDDLYMANNTCPVVGQRLARYWLCYADPSRRREGGITATGGCDGYDVEELSLSTFYEECYKEHYGPVVEALKAHGVDASYTIVNSDATEEVLLDQLHDFIAEAVAEHPNCNVSTESVSTEIVTTEQTEIVTTEQTEVVTTEQSEVVTEDTEIVTTEDTVMVVTTEQPAATTEDTVMVVTTEEPVTTEDTVMVVTTEQPVTTTEDTVMVVTTEEPAATTEDTVMVVTTEEPVTTTEDTVMVVTTEEAGDETDDDTTTSEGRSKSAVIVGVGAAAGGVAAVAGAAAGVKSIVTSMTTTVSDVHVDNDAMNNDLLEREQMTEVDASMFL